MYSCLEASKLPCIILNVGKSLSKTSKNLYALPNALGNCESNVTPGITVLSADKSGITTESK